MSHIETIRCFWCKRLLWNGRGVQRKCTCVGHGRNRFLLRVRAQRIRGLLDRLRCAV